MDPSGYNLQANLAANQEVCTPGMPVGRGTQSSPGNMPPFLGAGAPNTGWQNHDGTAIADESSAINQSASFSGSYTAMLNAIHERAAARATLPGSTSLAAEEHTGIASQSSCNLPKKVPISILVFHRRLTGMDSRCQLPLSRTCMRAAALPGVSEDIEASKTWIQGQDRKLSPAAAAAVICDSHNKLESAIPANAEVIQAQHQEEFTELLAKGLTDDSVRTYQRRRKRPNTQISQSDHTDLFTPAAFKERTQTQIGMQIPGASAENIETLQNEKEESLTRKVKPRRKKHRPKVIREDKTAKKQKAAVTTPEMKPPNQKAKRTYVRKKSNLSPLEKSSGPVSDRSISRGTENGVKSRTGSVRRRLQFELEEHRVQGGQPSTGNSCHRNQEKLVHDGSSSSSVTNSAVQIGHEMLVEVESSPGRLSVGMIRKLNDVSDEYIHLPDISPTPSQDNVGSTYDPEAARVGMTIMEGNNKNSELNYSNRSGFEMHGSAMVTSETESTRSQMTKVSNVEKNNYAPHGSEASIILRTAAEMLAFCQTGAIKKKRSVRVCRNSFVASMKIDENTSHAQTRLPQSCMEALYESSCIKFMTKKRSLKAKLRFPSSIQPKVSKKEIFSSESIFYGGSDGSKGSEGNFRQRPQASDDKRINLNVCCEVPERSSASASTEPCMDYLQGIASKLKYPDTNSEHVHRSEKPWFSSGSVFSDGSKGSEGTFQHTVPQALDDKRINLNICCEVPERSSLDTSYERCIHCLDGTASKLEYLDANTEHVHRTEMPPSLTMATVVSFGGTGGLSDALVPYDSGTVVPYQRPLLPAKKQRPRAKVNLDFETTRVWNLLMGKTDEPEDGTDVEKERWWQQERAVFEGRANSFIARMRLVQGDRHFSAWKGSVVDSVVGVFLTQNVADHLSSSAYMALAASFPPGSVHRDCMDDITIKDNGDIISVSAVGDKIMFDLFDNGARPDLGVNLEESITYKKIHVEMKENNTSCHELSEGLSYSFCSKGQNEGICNLQGTELDHKAQQFPDFSSTRSLTEIQFQKMSSFESVITSERSLNSEKNYAPENLVGGIGGAVYQQLGGNFDENSLAGLDTRFNESECHRIKTAAINDGGVGENGIPSTCMMYPFIPVVDRQQLDVTSELYVSSASSNSSSGSVSPLLSGKIENKLPPLMPFDLHATSRNGIDTPTTCSEFPGKSHDDKRTSFEASNLQEHELLCATGGVIAETSNSADESTLKPDFASYNGGPDKAAQESKPKKSRTTNKKSKENLDWDKLRRQACNDGHMKERTSDRRDSVDWEAVRSADVKNISHAIRERGMNNILAERIQSFLNRLVRDHGSIDLEWLRDIPPDSAKDYLLSIRGLGLKSVECVRLLTLHHLAFPVDTNVGRICVRLGWVPIQPLPESLQLHLLELYPVLETIQKYLWPRLCKLDQETLYELHYHLITFGKVFCTKSKPNCNACPMRGECKHFASAFASARLALPAPQEKSMVNSSNQFSFQNGSMPTPNSIDPPRLEGTIHARVHVANNSEPIIEEPESPREEECLQTLEKDIEDYYEDTGEIPTIKLNMEAFAQNLENCIKESNKDLQSDDIAKALVAIRTEAASIPVPKLKNVRRLRTEHYVYELPDSHPLVKQLGLDQRDPDDPSPYLLAIWTPDDIKEMGKAPKSCCDSQIEVGACNNETCHYCVSERENQSRYVRGTILVPCRTAMRGSFPLNGTYFQVNEVFADHKSSHDPIHVVREQLWSLQRRMVYFGTTVPTIFKGLTTEEIQHCFWRGFVCVRGFDMETRAPKPLLAQLHLAASRRKTAATEKETDAAKTSIA